MATIVNNPASDNTSNGMGFVLGFILLLIVVAMILFYGLPALRGNTGTGAQVTLPSTVNVQTK